MAKDLFYFISSLPSLRWGEKPAVGSRQFLDHCREELGEKPAAVLESLTLCPEGAQEGQTDVARRWSDYETFVRNTLAELRSAKTFKGQVAVKQRHTSHLSPSDVKRLEDVMAMTSPLERESALDQLRWTCLEEIGAGHYFDLGAIEVYVLKLMLLEKQSSRQLEAGRAAFQELMESGLSQARQARKDVEA